MPEKRRRGRGEASSTLVRVVAASGPRSLARSLHQKQSAADHQKFVSGRSRLLAGVLGLRLDFEIPQRGSGASFVVCSRETTRR